MEKYIRLNYMSFSTGFYGFSSGPNPWQKRFMAVGLEERGCRGQGPLPEARRRISAWRDLPEAPDLVGLDNYLHQAQFGNNARSTTWNRLTDLFCPL
jgi:hypothetical protein